MSKVLLIFAFSALFSYVMGQNFEDPYYKLRLKEQEDRIANFLRESAQSTTKLVETTTEAMETTTKLKKSTTKAVEATTKSYESTTNSDNLKSLENSSSTPKNCLNEKMPCLTLNDKCCPGNICVQMAVTNPFGICLSANLKQTILEAVVDVKEKVPLGYWDLIKFL